MEGNGCKAQKDLTNKSTSLQTPIFSRASPLSKTETDKTTMVHTITSNIWGKNPTTSKRRR